MGTELGFFAVVALATALSSAVLGGIFTQLGIVSEPNHRSSHNRTTAVGVGVVVPVIAASALLVRDASLPAGLLGGLMIAALGFVDDLLDLAVSVRIVGQFLIAGATLSLGGSSPVGVIVGSLVVVAAVNGLNFMDGINGITATAGVIIGACLSYAGSVAQSPAWSGVGLAMSAACLGYLTHNFPAARSFPGDVLPYFLGAVFVIGVIVLGRTHPIVFLGMGVLVPAGVDTSTTLIRRVRAGHGPASPHRDHVYQRLARATSHVHATLAFVGLETICAVALPVGVRWGWEVGLAYLLVASLGTLATLHLVSRRLASPDQVSLKSIGELS
ncbi:MAG: hypothetical protein IPH03_10310 [Tetrasphaera sp.]|nr:hypothetical protein [Tetrasphaera sp.]